MLSSYPLNIADLCNIPIITIKKLVPSFFDKGKYVLHHENFLLYLSLGLKIKKNTLRIRIQYITMAKAIPRI